MKNTRLKDVQDSRIIVQGIGFRLTPSIKKKVRMHSLRLLRHEPSIERIFFFLEHHQTNGVMKDFQATARIALRGPDITVRVRDFDLYRAISTLSHKLDRQLRKRSRKWLSKRTATLAA